MKFKPAKLAPAFIAAGVIVLVCGIRLIRPEVLERIERMTYDQRVRWASHFPQPSATNLGVVFVTDDSIAAVNKGLLGKSYGLYWPRHIYARVLRELAAQGANTVAYDVLFGETRADHAGELVPIAIWGEVTNFLSMLHPDEPPIIFRPEGGEEMVQVDADDYLAWQLRRTGIGVLAADQGVLPHPLFATNALALGDIGADRDADGVLRRARAFRDYRRWHSAFQQVEADPVLGVDLRQAKVEPGRILLPRSDSKDDPFIVPLDRDGNFDLTDFALKLPVGAEPKAKPFATERVWHMGIVLASRELNLDLSNPQIDLARGRITLNGANGVRRILPVDANGYFNINWEIPVNDPRLLATSMEELLKQDMAREDGQTEGSVAAWKGKLVIVGSSATGNDLTDVGVTPLEKNTFLISKHWNVANSIITGRFVRRASVGVEFLLIALLGALTAAVTWRLRVLSAAGGVIALMIIYWIAGVLLYVHERYWLPLVLPVIGAMLMQHVCLVTYRVVFEQSERRRVKSIFSHMVSPNIVNELITQERLPLGGARREVTVFFADVRGFTALTDTKQQQAENYVREHELAGDAAEAFFDEQARETLNTVNLYLALVADIVKKHEGTLDKYIGDCVMAFWGAPTPNPKHALACVRAAIDAQRAIHEVNQRRMAENQRMEADNVSRAANERLPLLPTLSLGTGINTGTVTVGLMGSEAHIRNYTAFGREVNLASRLEGVSGHGRIVISETTYQHLLHDDPELAATCIELEPTPLKGFQKPIRNFEVPWKTVVPSGQPLPTPA